MGVGPNETENYRKVLIWLIIFCVNGYVRLFCGIFPFLGVSHLLTAGCLLKIWKT